jgi:hypothetical protein
VKRDIPKLVEVTAEPIVEIKISIRKFSIIHIGEKDKRRKYSFLNFTFLMQGPYYVTVLKTV